MPDGLDGTWRDVDALVAAGHVAPARRAALDAVARRYAIAVPPAFASRIADPDGPLGRQFIPDEGELTTAPHEHPDPIADEALSPVAGVVHRYPDRVLLKPLLVCPVYCRFCFRREVVGPDGGVLAPDALARALDYIRARPAIREVILTGGDPLLLSPRRLAVILDALDAIPHVELLRIHTRVPTAAPALIDDALCRVLDRGRPVWIVLHANHADEFSAAAFAALARLRRAGAILLGQSVLLRAVNDDAAILENLFRTMLRTGVKPYYLHQLDPAPGTSRFHVPVAEGAALLRSLRARMTGVGIPTYVQDHGAGGKRPVGALAAEIG